MNWVFAVAAIIFGVTLINQLQQIVETLREISRALRAIQAVTELIYSREGE